MKFLFFLKNVFGDILGYILGGYEQSEVNLELWFGRKSRFKFRIYFTKIWNPSHFEKNENLICQKSVFLCFMSYLRNIRLVGDYFWPFVWGKNPDSNFTFSLTKIQNPQQNEKNEISIFSQKSIWGYEQSEVDLDLWLGRKSWFKFRISLTKIWNPVILKKMKIWFFVKKMVFLCFISYLRSIRVVSDEFGPFVGEKMPHQMSDILMS